MNVTMTPVGFKELQRDLKKMSGEIAVKVKQGAYDSGLDVRKQAILNLKALPAWKTGHLARSILVDRSSDGSIVEIGATAPYAPYVEFGTVKMEARPYLLPAYLSIVDVFFNKVKGLLKA